MVSSGENAESARGRGRGIEQPFDRLSDFDYELDESLIAHFPESRRDESRLMVVDRATGSIAHRKFSEILSYFNSGDVIVGNNTRVIKARLLGQRETGGKIEFLMLEPKSPFRWEGILQSSARQVAGLKFQIPCRDGSVLQACLTRGSTESPVGTVEVEFDRDPLSLDVGELPLPPYIAREGKRSTSDDDSRYQTVYAKEAGSAAAPTAGLHFTSELIAALLARGVSWQEITLHVGLGTFRPVKVEALSDHEMHEERYAISESVAREVAQAKRAGRKITAIGTTATRALESAALAAAGERHAGTGVVATSSESLLAVGSARTRLFVRPGHGEFRVVDRLITNFHLPKSTLLMLVSAFAGRDLILRAYEEATRERYRFFSYGDAMLIV